MFLLMADALAELRALIARHARPDETSDRRRAAVRSRAGEPAAARSGTILAVIAQGEKRLAIGDRVYDYGPGQYLVACSTCPSPATLPRQRALSRRSASGSCCAQRRSPRCCSEAGGWSVVRRRRGAGAAASAPGGAASPLGGAARRPPLRRSASRDADAALLDAVVRMVRLLDAAPADRGGAGR